MDSKLLKKGYGLDQKGEVSDFGHEEGKNVEDTATPIDQKDRNPQINPVNSQVDGEALAEWPELGEHMTQFPGHRSVEHGVRVASIKALIASRNWEKMFKELIDVYKQTGVNTDFGKTTLEKRIDDEILWAKKTFKQNPALISWWLRWVRITILYDFRTSLPESEAKDKLNTIFQRDFPSFQEYGVTEGNLWHFENSEKQFKQQWQHMMSLPIDFSRIKPKNKPMDLLFPEYEKLEKEWKESRSTTLVPDPEDKIYLQYDKNNAWWLLDRTYCEAEGKAMGHCGNSGNPHEGDRILSFRTKKGGNMWEPNLTFIIDRHGQLGEMKGRGNEKPVAKYFPAIIQLLKSDIVKGIKGGGYMPENNFSMDDLPEAQRDALYKEKPGLMTASDYLKTLPIDPKTNQPVLDETFGEKLVAYFDTGEWSEPAYWSPDLKAVILHTYDDLRALIKQNGDRNMENLADYDIDEAASQNQGDPKEMAESIIYRLSRQEREKLGLILKWEVSDEDMQGWLQTEGDRLDEDPDDLEFDPNDSDDIASLAEYANARFFDDFQQAWTDATYSAIQERITSLMASAAEDAGYLTKDMSDPDAKWFCGLTYREALDWVDNDRDPNFEPDVIHGDRHGYDMDPNVNPAKAAKAFKELYNIDSMFDKLVPEEMKAGMKYKDTEKPQEFGQYVNRVAALKTAWENAWEKPIEEYEGEYPKDQPEEKQREFWRRGKEWKASVLAALSCGKVTAKQLRERKIYTQPPADDFKPLPAHLWHVATAASKIKQNGIMSRFELGIGHGPGLGGGDDSSISFTDDKATADAIYKAILTARQVARGELTVAQMVDEAKKGIGADRPYYDAMAQFYGSSYGPLQDTINGIARESGSMGRQPKGDYQWTPDPTSSWMGGDGQPRYGQWTRPLTDDEMREAAWWIFKAWALARQNAGGPMDPLFFQTDTKALARVPEEEIEIMEFRPIPGAMGTRANSLGEWRTYSGKAVEFVKAWKPKTASPDFGYGQYNPGKEDALKNLLWDVDSAPTYVNIWASTDTNLESRCGNIECYPADAKRKAEGFNKADWFVAQVTTDPDFRGTGLGQMLYDKAIAEIKNRGGEALWSDVTGVTRTPDADSAWKRLGRRYPVKFDDKRERFRLDLVTEPKTAAEREILKPAKEKIESNESLISLLEPTWGGRTGPEREKKLLPTVSVFISKYGSYRFVKFQNDKPIAALQIMKTGPKSGHVANAYVLPEFRKQGIGTELIRCARYWYFNKLDFSNDTSRQGQIFVDKMKEHKEAAPVRVWYHGTATANLDSIKSEGVQPSGKKKVWDEDPYASMNSPDRSSIGGSYWTINLMSAISAPRQNAKNNTRPDSILIVCAELQPNAMYMDEDNIVAPLMHPLGHLSDSTYHLLRFYLAHEAKDAAWQGDIDKFRQSYIDDFIGKLERDFKEKGIEFHSDLKARLMEILPKAWDAALARQVAYGAKSNPTDFKRVYSDLHPEIEWKDIPTPEQVLPAPRDAEKNFRAYLEQLTKTLRILARQDTSEGDYPQYPRGTARITTPVGFSGANRITALVEIRDSKKYRGESRWEDRNGGRVKVQSEGPTPIIVHYGTPPSDFWRQYETRVGDNFFVQTAEGKILREAPAPEEMPKAAAVFSTKDFKFAFSFPVELRKKILAQGRRMATPANCQEASYMWAKWLVANGVSDVTVVHGILVLPNGDDLGHTWVEVEGTTFDPTAGQFYKGDMDSAEYDTHDYEEIAKTASVRKYPSVEEFLKDSKVRCDVEDAVYSKFADKIDRIGDDATVEAWVNKKIDEAIIRRYDKMVEFFDKAQYPMTIYRALRLDKPEDLKTEGIGIYWTWDEKAALPDGKADFGGDRGKKIYVLRAEANEGDIDWHQTFHSKYRYPEEKEVNLNDHAAIKLTGMKLMGGRWKPEAQMVTAAGAAAYIPKFEKFIESNGGLSNRDWYNHEGMLEDCADRLGIDDPTEEQIREYAFKRYKQEYNDWAKFYKKKKFPMTIYRAVQVPTLADIDFEDTGIYWSWDEDHARVYDTRHHKGIVFVIRGTVTPEEVDWNGTMNAAMNTGDEECEVTLRYGADIEMTGIRPKNEPGKWYMPAVTGGDRWNLVGKEPTVAKSIRANQDFSFQNHNELMSVNPALPHKTEPKLLTPIEICDSVGSCSQTK